MPDELDRAKMHHVGQFDDALIPLSAQTFRDMVEHSPDMVSLHDPGGVYQYVSPACSTLLGYRPFELEGHNAYEFFHPDDLHAIQQSHDAVIERIETQTVRYRVRNWQGEYVWVETTSRTMRNPHTGEPERIIAITRKARASEQQKAKLIVHGNGTANGKATRRRRSGTGTPPHPQP